MKKYIIKIIIVCGFIISHIAVQAQFIKAELKVSGLTCSMCSFATQKQLQTLTFIDSIGTDLNHTTFILSFKKDSIVDPELIKKKVEDAGFSVASLVFTFHFDNLKIENNYQMGYQNSLYTFMNVKPRTLNGNAKIKILDKGFVTNKEYKKYLKDIAAINREQASKTQKENSIYHITIL